MKKPGKAYTRMSTADLAAATKEFDEDFVFEKAKPLTAADRKRHARARKRGRPKARQGVENVRITIDRGLLREVDAFARARRMSRSELIARGLRAVLAAG